MEVPLAQGRGVALIDDGDAALVLPHRWCLHPKGYAQAAKGLLMHRLIMGAAKGQYVDHRNHDKLDNRRANLRLCQDAANRSLPASGFKGVHPYGPKWQATLDGGTYSTPEAAAVAYNVAARAKYGDFALTNPLGMTIEEEEAAHEAFRHPTTSRYRGVTRAGKRWRAQLTVNGKKVLNAFFDTEEEAAAAYLAARPPGHRFPLNKRPSRGS